MGHERWVSVNIKCRNLMFVMVTARKDRDRIVCTSELSKMLFDVNSNVHLELRWP